MSHVISGEQEANLDPGKETLQHSATAEAAGYASADEQQ